MPVVTKSETRAVLASSKDAQVSKMAKDVELVVALTAVLNESIKLAGEIPRNKTEAAEFMVNKGLAISKVAETASASKNLELTNFALGQTMKSLGLMKVVGMTPAKASVFITLTMAEKVVSVAGMAQISKCQMAVASLAATTGMGVFVCAGSAGIGCIAGAIAVASDAFNVYGQCRAN